MHDPSLLAVIKQLQILPGVGERGAKRFMQHLLQFKRTEGVELAKLLESVLRQTKHCQCCRNYTTDEVCVLCSQVHRNTQQLCIVSSPEAIEVLEEAGYEGFYFVLFGLLSPIKGIGPVELGLEALMQRANALGVSEVIVALPGTVEGEATTQMIMDHLPASLKVSRLAQGVPRGSDVAHLDSLTLSQALQARSQV